MKQSRILRPSSVRTGMFWRFGPPPEIDTTALMPKAIVAKVAYVPGTAFYADGFGSWSLRLSYCYPTPERIREGVKALGGVIKQEMASRKGFELKG